MWANLHGTWGYKAGTNGTPTIPKGSQILKIIAHASAGGATVAINGGDALPIVNGAPPTVLDFHHLLIVSPNAENPIVFTGTDQFFVEFVKPS